MAEWFQMGGYGLYVWLSYGISFAAIIGLGFVRSRGLKKALARQSVLTSTPERQETGDEDMI